MRSIRVLYILTLSATLAWSHADLDSFSDEDYGIDSPLFSSDDLSGSQLFTDDISMGDNSAFTNSLIDGDANFLFAESLADCSSDDAFQPRRKIRVRNDPSCPSGLGSNNPSVRLPNADDLNKIANSSPDSSKLDKNRNKGLGYYSICPSGSKKIVDWVVCGIQGGAIGLATWKYDVVDAELCECFAWSFPRIYSSFLFFTCTYTTSNE